MPRSQAPQGNAVQEEARLHQLIDALTLKSRRPAETIPEGVEVVPVERVVVGVGSDPATEWAVEWAQALGPVFNPHVTLLHVQTPAMMNYTGIWGAPIVPEAPDAAVAQEKIELRLLDDAAGRLREAGLDASIRQARGSPVREIVKAAREERADLVIVGSPPHSGLERLLLGSIADGVKNHADTNVLLAKGPPTPGDILCPVDGSWMSKRAATLALRIARAWGGKLHVLHVLEPPKDVPAASRDSRLQALREDLGLPWNDLPNVDFQLLAGKPASVIPLEADRTQARLIAMGNRGLGGLRSLVAGSVTNSVTHHVPQSVLLVKGPRVDLLDASFVI